MIPKTSVAQNASAFNDDITRRGTGSRFARPAATGAMRMRVSSGISSFQLVELAGVHRGERFADAVNENSENHHGDQHVEENSEFDDERHSVSGQRDSSEHHAVFHREQR